MMCGAVAGQYGLSVLILDHAKAAGEKIRISGGGRCNFTNINCRPDNFISQNPHFCKSALAGFTPQDFIDQLDMAGIAWHEKTLGQLFCDGKAGQIIEMLLQACAFGRNKITLERKILDVKADQGGFCVLTSDARYTSRALVVACGGPSIPKMGASGFGYQIAQNFGLKVIPPCAALVPLIFDDAQKESTKALAGISAPVCVWVGKTKFKEAMLFTHRGLSGPAILQISSYWSPGDTIYIDLIPDQNVRALLQEARVQNPRQSPSGFLDDYLPKRLAQYMAHNTPYQRLADMNDAELDRFAAGVQSWALQPTGSEGYRTAEVTRGGVDTDALSSKTMQSKQVPGLYFIGEVVDVTGHLGGHNFQWAWASGVAAGNALGNQL